MNDTELLDLLKRYPEDDQVKALAQALRTQYESSLYLTCKHLLGYFQMTRHTHGKMCDALEADTPRKCIVMPRGTFKSSVGTVGYSIWSLMRNPNERILIDSEVYSNSKNFLREIKSHLEKPILEMLYGRWKTDHNWNEGEITIRQRTQIYKEATITCGGIETVKVGQHYTKIIGDDYNSRNNSETSEGRQKVLNHYKMNTAILEPGGVYVVIGTRYAVDDVPGFIIANEVPEHNGLIPSP